MNPDRNPASGKVTLWTRQDIRSLEELKMNGVIRITPQHLKEKFEEITDYIASLYSWFVQAANQRVPKPAEVMFPVWCSVSEANMLRPTEETVVYVLEVDESEVIYFDSVKWDYVLNHLYIPKDSDDAQTYREEMRRRGHRDVYSFFDHKTAHFYARERTEIMNSWSRIFEIDQWDIFRVQANLWEIRNGMVKSILYQQDVVSNEHLKNERKFDVQADTFYNGNR
ncbi:DUF3841 domain-containing protein [Anoxynatronum buryatiense]|nr:DUF3841 domain-containing protein [Anoxynatronum buryatiense]